MSITFDDFVNSFAMLEWELSPFYNLFSIVKLECKLFTCSLLLLLVVPPLLTV